MTSETLGGFGRHIRSDTQIPVTDDNDTSPIAITEILADIPSGAPGDANGDGDFRVIARKCPIHIDVERR